ncbi:MAG: 50S ribosomal protein L9 [Parcubacteria group bacterium]|jgi:large subunit ribosomal protein L9
MKVILFKDVPSIGKAGDIKNVSDGYARNFLLPKKLAEIANAASLQKAELLKKKQQESEQADLEKIQKVAETLQGCEIVIMAKEKDGKLFGSINAKAIAKELKKENLLVDDKLIFLPEPIKEIGDYDVKVELSHGIEASIHVVVESAQ